MEFLVFDLEATCWNSPGTQMRQQEVIEIGACILDGYGHIRDQFQRFVKPIKFPVLSPYCRNLTDIQQEDIDKAKDFPYVMNQFFDWAEMEDRDYYYCAWGSADRELLLSNASLHNYSLDWFSYYLDIKNLYHRNRSLSKFQGLDRVLYSNGFSFEGKRHRALYDALNLAKLVSKFKEEWI